MLGRFLKGGLSLLLLAALDVSACEKHPAAAVRGSPEYLHGALTGDTDAQSAVADCYERGGCAGIPQDAALACAWRGVRLASQRPGLALADSTAFATACAPADPTFRQRASIAFADLTTRVYGRPRPALAQLIGQTNGRSLLHPSMEVVRTRANDELRAMHRGEQLPPFGKPTVEQDGVTLGWISCAGMVCLDGVTPSFGGGVVSYSFQVRQDGTSSAPKLAASLAAAALEAPAVADVLSQPGPAAREEGGVCWRTGSQNGLASVEATLGPCDGPARGG